MCNSALALFLMCVFLTVYSWKSRAGRHNRTFLHSSVVSAKGSDYFTVWTFSTYLLITTGIQMSLSTKPCKECGEANHVRAMACNSCGESFRNQGHPRGTTHARRCPDFNSTVQLPTDWCHLIESVNIDNELLNAFHSSVPLTGSHSV